MTDDSDAPKSLGPHDWPSPDRNGWKRACAPCDPFDRVSGRASLWRSDTRKDYEYGYGRWLAWLEQHDDLDRRAAPGERATPERVRAFCKHLKDSGLAPYTVAGALMGLSRVLSAIDPDGEYWWISTASRRLHALARPVTDVTARLRSIDELAQFANALMWEAEHGRFRSAFDRALLFRDGLVIAALTNRALRISNMVSIELGRHLYRAGDGWRLEFPAEEMKAGRPFGMPWPAELQQALEQYISLHRNVLAGDRVGFSDDHGPLWIARKGGGLSVWHLRARIEKLTKEEFGTAINPHAFRHLLATTVATENPDGASGIAAMLAHSSIETSEVYYNKARQVDANNQLQSVVMSMRRRR